jgi:release factor glutamine methyltransferase
MIHPVENEYHLSFKENPNFYYLGLGKILNLPVNTDVFMPSNAGLFFWETIHGSYADKLSHNMRALDLGCGSGFVAMGLALFGCGHVTASDVNPMHVEYAREQFARNVPAGSKSTFVVSDLYEALDEEKFDLIAFNCPGWATPTDKFAAEIKKYPDHNTIQCLRVIR